MARLDPVRETDRLVLRPYDAEDFSTLERLLADESVNRYLYSEPRSGEEARAALQQRLDAAANPDEPALHVCVALRDTGEVVGDFVLFWDPTHRQGEVGGSLLPAHQGRGYATEVYAALLRVAFDDLDLHRVVGRCDARNTPSVRTLEKAGLVAEAHLVENEFVKGEWTSEIVLAILAADWRDAR